MKLLLKCLNLKLWSVILFLLNPLYINCVNSCAASIAPRPLSSLQTTPTHVLAAVVAPMKEFEYPKRVMY